MPQKFDVNRDGDLTREEFGEGLKSLHLGLTDAQVKDVCKRVDKDGDGKISYGEFISKFGGDSGKRGRFKHYKRKVG